MTNKEFAKKLEKRTVKFAIEVINLSSSLANTPEALFLRNQITKSATSIGTNLERQTDLEVRKILKIK